jgi:hypothetical protein
MNSRPHKSTLAALATLGLLAFPAAASSAVDYSKNAATGDYAHGPLPPAGLTKDYSQNGATGDYAPAETPSVHVVTAADDGGFDWATPQSAPASRSLWPSSLSRRRSSGVGGSPLQPPKWRPSRYLAPAGG